MSVNIFGFPCPFDAFIHCPTKNPKSVSLPPLYRATWLAFSMSIVSTIASRAPVSFDCFSPSFSTHSVASPHSNTSFSMTSFEFVEESSSAFTICMTFPTSLAHHLTWDRSIFSVCHSNIAKSIVVI